MEETIVENIVIPISKEGAMRTDFLVHWTGRDIATNRLEMNDAHRRGM